MPDGSVVISGGQARLHKRSEGLALTLGAPLLFWAGTRDRQLNQTERAGLLVLGLGTLLIDGYLYKKYSKSSKSS